MFLSKAAKTRRNLGFFTPPYGRGLGVLSAVFIICFSLNAFAEKITCKTGMQEYQYTVSYSCGRGTTTSTALPANATATFGTTFTPTSISSAMCTPPTGEVRVGLEIWVDGAKVAELASTGISGFRYLYHGDITIAARFVPVVSNPRLLTMFHDLKALGYTGENTNMTWTANYIYGYVRGKSSCSPVEPENTNGYAGFAPKTSVQAQIVNADKTGVNCYCKLAEPYMEKSPWVLGNRYGSVSSCTGDCPWHCGWKLTVWEWDYPGIRAIFGAADFLD